MSTRSSIVFHDDEESGIKIHVYRELLEECEEFATRLEIETPNVTVNIALPKAIRERLGIDG